ncbi:hydrophobin [Fusarium subglutinans]|uniref:Hydrophobin n=1 Tax=Gibberella subglutinans TaxID=42677 RepID=A0A8H5PH83_GIBSU|nr:hydrophobin [Fusarium subglutinans]KAF5596437.1 hydrophobin [Fusarium subglutinans]
MRFLAFTGVCLPLISGSPVDISLPELSPRLVTTTEQLSCGVVGHKPDSILTRSRKCRLVDYQELCSAITGCKSYAESSAKCLLFSSPVAEGFQQDSTSPYTLYDLECSMPTSSATETPPEATNSATTRLSTSGTEAAATSNAQPSSTAATFTTELSTELASASTSTFSEPITATTTDHTTYAESASASVSSDVTSTAIALGSNTGTTITGDETTTTAGGTTTASLSTPTVYIIRLVNPDESTFGFVSSTIDFNRLSGLREKALEIQISAPEPDATSHLDIVHAETFGGLTRLCAVQSTHNTNADLGSDSSFFNYLSTCTPTGSLTVKGPPGSVPAYIYHAWSNWGSLHGYTLAAESAIVSQHEERRLANTNATSQWTVDPDTLEVTASWINTDGSAPPTTLFVPETSNWIGWTGSLSALQAAFPNQPYKRIKLVLEPIL